MATATEARAVHTPEELLEIDDRPMPELIDGQLVEREPMGQEADAIAANFVFFLLGFTKSRQLGVVNGAQGSYQIFADDPKKVRIPDVSFTSRERISGGPAKEHGKAVPDLAVEVLSPNESAIKVALKINDFLAVGVRLIWVANPETRDIHVYRADGTVSLVKSGETLDGGDVLPGFACPVNDLFTI